MGAGYLWFKTPGLGLDRRTQGREQPASAAAAAHIPAQPFVHPRSVRVCFRADENRSYLLIMFVVGHATRTK